MNLNLEDHARIAHTATTPLLQDGDPKSLTLLTAETLFSTPTPYQEATLTMASITPRATHCLGQPRLVTFHHAQEEASGLGVWCAWEPMFLHASIQPRLTWLMHYRDQGSTECAKLRVNTLQELRFGTKESRQGWAN